MRPWQTPPLQRLPAAKSVSAFCKGQAGRGGVARAAAPGNRPAKQQRVGKIRKRDLALGRRGGARLGGDRRGGQRLCKGARPISLPEASKPLRDVAGFRAHGVALSRRASPQGFCNGSSNADGVEIRFVGRPLGTCDHPDAARRFNAAAKSIGRLRQKVLLVFVRFVNQAIETCDRAAARDVVARRGAPRATGACGDARGTRIGRLASLLTAAGACRARAVHQECRVRTRRKRARQLSTQQRR